MRNAIFLAALFLVAVTVSPAWAGTTDCPDCLGGAQCYSLGVTKRDPAENRPRQIIACLKNESASHETDCTQGIPCYWKVIGREEKNKPLTLPAETLKHFHVYCQNEEKNFINCASACSRYCRNSCVNSSTDDASRVNCDVDPSGRYYSSGMNYKGGVFLTWTAEGGKCVCYN